MRKCRLATLDEAQMRVEDPLDNEPWLRRAIGALLALALIGFLAHYGDPLDSRHGWGMSTPVPGLPPPSDAMASLQFLTAQRAYPLPDIPAERYQRAWERVETDVRRARAGFARGRQALSPPWESMGPLNMGGRTIALAVDPLTPNTVWAGAASGGLWKTTTAGVGAAAWQYVETGYPVLGVNAIAIDPADPQVIYIGTGEVYGRDSSIGGLYIRTTRGSYGIGILKSEDRGATWTKSLDWSYENQRGVLAMDVDPVNSQRVFAGTTEGVFRSTDAGGTWEQVLSEPMAVDLLINPSSPDTLYASCGNLGIPSNAGIWRSTDGGEIWQELTSGLPSTWTGKTMLDLFEAAPEVVYADVANWDSQVEPAGVGLYRSLDAGESWQLLSGEDEGYGNIARYQGWFSHFLVVHPSDSTKVLSAGVDVYKSEDGGDSFSRRSWWSEGYQGLVAAGASEGPTWFSHADHHAFARHPVFDNAVYLANDGGVFYTDNFGETFQARNGGYQTTQFYGGFTSSPADSTLALGGLQDNNTLIYQGDPAWVRTLGGDGGFTGLDPDQPWIAFASTQYGRIYRSVNGGAPGTWARVNGQMEGQGNVVFVAPFAQAPGRPEIIYAGRTHVWRSDDFGSNWSRRHPAELDGNPILTISVSPFDPEVVWAATVPDVAAASAFYSSNGGTTWTEVSEGLPDRYPVDIIASPHSVSVAYAVFSGFGTGHVFRFESGAWTDITGNLPDIPTSALAVDPFDPDYLYVGNDFGVWTSADGGTSWQAFSDGMPTAALVMDLSVSLENGSLRAITHGLGAWERPLLGDSSTLPSGPEGVVLEQNRPNPFNASTRITYYLPEAMHVRLEVFNVRGQQVMLLVDREMSAGFHGATVLGSRLASGVYFYRLMVGNRVITRKMLLLK